MRRALRMTSLIGLVAAAIGLVPGVLAGSADAAAVRPLAGFTTNTLPANDDGSTGLVPIGFTIDFFGSSYSQLYVNNNGNVTFDSGLGTYTPFDLTSTGRVIIAPFFGDVDTRGGLSALVTYGNDVVNGRPAFGVNWAGVGVGYYAYHTDKLNVFQLILIDRSDISPGGFDIEFNYDQIQWETGDASGGSGGLGGFSARAGYSNGTGAPATFFELPGSAVNGAFLDTNPASGLIYNRLNNPQNGRYLFFVRGGSPCPPPAPPVCTEQDPCHSLRQAEICPSDAAVSEDSITVEPPTGSFCPGDQVGVNHVNDGTFAEIVADDDIVCHEACVSTCSEYCVALPLSSCWQVCLRRCSNGACIEWETRCAIDGTQTQCVNNCFNQCSANFDPVAASSSFVSPCGFPIEETMDVRSSDGACTGALISTQSLTGAGTAAANVTLPLEPGPYDLCVGERFVQTITVEPCPQPACAIRVPGNAWSLLQGVGEVLPVTIAAGDAAGGSYNISLLRFEDDAHTITMALPPFVSATEVVAVPDGGSAGFELVATDPQPVGRQGLWPGVIIRADGPATCQTTLSIEITCTGDADCDDGNPCTVDRCAPADRQADLQGCVVVPEADGTLCSDGDLCTQDDACQAGVCTGGDPVVCAPLDECHDAGLCDPTSGLCSNPEKPDGADCDDSDACTQTDICQGGACTGSDFLVCAAPDQCHEGICDPATGVCSSPARPDGTPCEDGEVCTIGDACTGGVCGGGPTCGNGAVDGDCGEQCDDGNTLDGDCCSANCQAEDLGTATCGIGVCAQTMARCENGVPQPCAPGTPEPEICDSQDNDCDGAIDEGGVCNQPPDCGGAAARPGELWPPSHRLVTVAVGGVTDPDGDPIAVTITGIAQDEPLKAVGAGNTCPDGAGVGTSTARLRAERTGNPAVPGDGRVYHVDFTASDGRGGTCSGTARVCVPHDQRPGHVCVDQGPLVNSTGPCS